MSGLKSKEVKSAGGGGLDTELFELIYEPTTTVEELDEFCSGPEAEMTVMSILSLPKGMLDDSECVGRINISDKLLNLIFSNYQLTISILNHETAIAQMFDRAKTVELFALSSSHSAMLSDSSLLGLVTNADYMRYAAEDPIILSSIFSSYVNRTAIFDVGGKEVADILLRESAHARQWLLENASITYRHSNNGRRTLNKRCYYLRQRCYSTHSSYHQYAGTFIGDHRTGEINLGTVSSAWRDLNERCFPMTQRHTVGNNSWWTDATYVEME